MFFVVFLFYQYITGAHDYLLPAENAFCQIKYIVNLGLHISNKSLNRNNHISLRQDNAQLAAGAVTSKTSSGVAPELITVARSPVRCAVAADKYPVNKPLIICMNRNSVFSGSYIVGYIYLIVIIVKIKARSGTQSHEFAVYIQLITVICCYVYLNSAIFIHIKLFAENFRTSIATSL